MTTATRPVPYAAQIAQMKNPMVQVELISPKDGGVASPCPAILQARREAGPVQSMVKTERPFAGVPGR